MRRREFITLLGGAAAVWPLTVRAQKPSYRIGWLVFGGATLGPIDQSLKDALAQAGFVDGRNIEIIFRYANGKADQLARLAAELVAQKPHLLLAVGGMLLSRCSRQAMAAYRSSVAVAIAPCARKLPCLLLGQARISPGSRSSPMKWRPSGWNFSRK